GESRHFPRQLHIAARLVVKSAPPRHPRGPQGARQRVPVPLNGVAVVGVPPTKALDLAPAGSCRRLMERGDRGGRDAISYALRYRNRIGERKVRDPTVADRGTFDLCRNETRERYSSAARYFPRDAEGRTFRTELVQLLPDVTQIAR